MYEHRRNKSLPYPENLFSTIKNLPMPKHVDFEKTMREKVLTIVESDGDSVLTNNQVLTTRHKDIILKTFKDGETLILIGEDYNLTKERIRQILNQGLWMLFRECRLP